MHMFIKSSVVACAVAFALTLAAHSQAAAAPQQVPEACFNGNTFVRNGIAYANQCVTWRYAYGRNRCTRWMPVPCGGGGIGNR
jgi:hypothetical protein